uniref:Protein VP3 n=1 Tax=Human rotavirus A TaxID=10941 RepID=A0A5J6NUA7_9REOV|nr:VP3 protein [Human rotavirus A]
MKVLALRHSVAQVYADTQTYLHDASKDEYENAFLISNLTTHNILYLNYSLKTLKILNKSGIAAVEVQSPDELFTLIRCNFTYDYENNIIYLHDYSYYTNNEIRTDQHWITKTDITDYLLPGWKLTYVGYNGKNTRGHYNFSFLCQNAATDDDIIIEYIYSNELDFQNFLLRKIKERMTTSLPIARLSNRVFRDKLFPSIVNMYEKVINVGPRNESMFTFLNFPTIKQFSNGAYIVKHTIKLKQEKWLGKRVSQFDIGQYKNMLHVVTTIYYYYNLHSSKPIIYMLGSAPSYWIHDIKQYSDFIFETWDPLDTPYSTIHHKELFFDKDVNKLKDNSILYIDIRTDRGNTDWKEWRKVVEQQTMSNLNIAYKYLSTGKAKVCCVKLTAMDLELPITAKLLHHPTTELRLEFYHILLLWCTIETKIYMLGAPSYGFINSILIGNISIRPPSTIKELFFDKVINLNNSILYIDIRTDRKNMDSGEKWWNSTVNINIAYKYRPTGKAKVCCVWKLTAMDLEFNHAIITSSSNYLSRSEFYAILDVWDIITIKRFIPKGIYMPLKIDIITNRKCIYTTSFQIESIPTDYIHIYALSNDFIQGKMSLIINKQKQSLFAYTYNALIYYRYNYAFDLKRWIYLHSIGKVAVEGGRYYEHAPIELIYACRSAREFAILQDDLTVLRYANEIEGYINKVYSITYADDPNYFIGIKFDNIPYEYDVKVPHLTLGVLFISDNMIHDVVTVLKKMKTELFKTEISTSYTYMLSDNIYVANVSGVLSTYFKLYNMFYRNHITFGQSRMFIPHITLSFSNKQTVRIESTRLKINSIYLRKIKGETVFDMSE